jgi:NADH:ubiquinone oxidoreductase subunit 2 (subunit N)
VVGALTTVIGLVFYLRVVITMFSSETDDSAGVDSLEVSITSRFAVVIAAAVTLTFGVLPWPLLDFVRSAIPF